MAWEQVLNKVPKAKGVLVTAGGNGSSYAFRDPAGGKPITNRVRRVLALRSLIWSRNCLQVP